MNNKVAGKQQVLSEAAALAATKYGCGPVHFSGTDEALYERHLLFDNSVDLAAATARPIRGARPVSARRSLAALALNAKHVRSAKS